MNPAQLSFAILALLPAILLSSEANTEALCQATAVSVPAPGLKCEYVTNSNPYLLIGPLKAELMNTKPIIYAYHDVIFESEIKVIQTLAPPQFDRHRRRGDGDGDRVRINMVTWLRSHEHSILERIDQRISLITGLDMESAEPLQITNYALGGYYQSHIDSTVVLDPEAGLRIATFMFYMSEVDVGGATVFPYANLTLWPRKGSAVLWFNLHEDGVGDERTRHAACPVERGSKWVANKWIRERGQEFRRPCGLRPSIE